MLYGRCMGHLQVLSAALLPFQALLSGSLIPVHPLHWRQSVGDGLSGLIHREEGAIESITT